MSVPTFSQLLSDYLTRSGISDSELARTIGVRRQTIFRWKEGLVERPRAREDVLRCAKKLRLTPEERDLLLLAAGFAPESLPTDGLPPPEVAVDPIRRTVETGEPLGAVEGTQTTQTLAQLGQDTASIPAPAPEQAPAPAPAASEVAAQSPAEIGTDPSMPAPAQQQIPSGLPLTVGAWSQLLLQQPHSRYVAGGLLLSLLAVILLFIYRLPLPTQPQPDPTPTRAVIAVPIGAPGSTPGSDFPAIYPKAAVSETLLIVAPFRGYTTSERYNVAGRIREALEEEIAAARLISTTIAIWPQEIGDPTELGPVLAASDAALVIWGEYDSGRVRVNLDGQKNVTEKHDFPLSSPTELITTITSTLPKEIRMLALTVLGRLLRNQGDFAKATNAFTQAIRLNPGDPKTTARLYFYLGHMAEQMDTPADLARALTYYDAALGANPRLIDALYNRGTVHLNRSYQVAVDDPVFRHSLDAAIADLTAVISERPDYLAAYQNRGVAYYERNVTGDQAAAVADYTHITAVEPENVRAYFHRALAELRGNLGRGWIDDFAHSLTLNPNYYPATNGLCWGYALAEQPEIALPYCDAAVALDPTGASRDSRAIVYAQLGRYPEAIADFSAYLAWVETMESPALYVRYRGPIVETWVAQLQAGENPFDRTLLDSLR